MVSPYVAPNSTWHAACAERKWGRTGQGRDTRSPSLNVTKLTERGRSPPWLAWSTTRQVRTAVQKAIVFKKKKKMAGWGKIYIHACQNRQRTAETILKCTKVLKPYVVYQQLPAPEVKYTSRTNSQRDEICGYQAQSGGGAGGRWSKAQTCSCKISTADHVHHDKRD